MLNKNAAVAHRANGQHRHEEVTVNVGTGAFSRGHKIQKLYYLGDTHQTNFIQVRDKIREVVPAMFDGLAANLFRDNKLAEHGTVIRPKDTMPKLDDDGQPVYQKGTSDVILVPNPTFRAELEDYKRESSRVDIEKQKLKGQLAGIWLFLTEILSSSSVDRLSAQETYLDIQKEQDPVKLWNLIVLTHLDKADVDTIARLITANLNFFTLAQEPGEELLDYHRRFKESYERLLAAEPEKFFENLPQMFVRLFLGNLEPRFAEYKLDVLNGIQLRDESWPATVTQIATDARQFLVRRAKVSGKVTGLSQTGTLLHTTEESTMVAYNKSAPKTGGCHHCGGAHYLSACPTHDPETHSHYGINLRPRKDPKEPVGPEPAITRGGRGGRRGRGRGGRGPVGGRKGEAAHIASDKDEHVFSYTPRFDLPEELDFGEDSLGHEDSIFMIRDSEDMTQPAVPATASGEDEIIRLIGLPRTIPDPEGAPSKKKRPIQRGEHTCGIAQHSQHTCSITVNGVTISALGPAVHPPDLIQQAIERGDMLERGHTVAELREMARSRPLSPDSLALQARGLMNQEHERQLAAEWEQDRKDRLRGPSEPYEPRRGPPMTTSDHTTNVAYAERRNSTRHRFPEHLVHPEIRLLVDARMDRAWPDATRPKERQAYPREMHEMSKSIRGDFHGERRHTVDTDRNERARNATIEHLRPNTRPLTPNSTDPLRIVSDLEDAAIREHLDGIRVTPGEPCGIDNHGVMTLEERFADDPVLLLSVIKLLVRYDNGVASQRMQGIHNPSWRACIHGHLVGNRAIPETMEEFYGMVAAEYNADNAPAPEYIPEIIPIVWRGPRISRERRVPLGGSIQGGGATPVSTLDEEQDGLGYSQGPEMDSEPEAQQS